MPAFQAVGFVMFLVPWTFYAVFSASTGTMEIKTIEAGPATYSYKVFTYDEDTVKRAWVSCYVCCMYVLYICVVYIVPFVLFVLDISVHHRVRFE